MNKKQVSVNRLGNFALRFLILQPIAYMFVAIFLARSDVRLFFLVTAGLLFNTLLLLHKAEIKKEKIVAIVIVVLASIGLSAASILTIEKIELLKNPQHVTSCGLSPVVACSPVITSPQATAIGGVPNPIFGIFGFACVLTAGMTILAGAQALNRVWWRTLLAGIVFGVGFCIWLIHEGIYEIGSLCLYCMTTWMVTFTLFWVVLAEMIRNGSCTVLPGRLRQLIVRYRDGLITASIGAVVLLIYFRWASYWNSLL